MPMTTDSQINAADRDRALRDEEMARRAGFSPAPPLYAIGTPVNNMGEDNYRVSRFSFEEMPRFADVVGNACANIEGEERQDYRIDLGLMEMTGDGRLRPRDRHDARGALLTDHSWAQFINAGPFPPHANTYLRNCPSPLRAININEFLARAQGTRLVARTRINRNRDREIFAFVSPKYHPFDAPDIAKVMTDIIAPGAKGELLYDGSRFCLSAQYHSDIQPQSCVAGEIFRAMILVDTADDGSRRLRVRAGVVRNLCLNLIILDTATQEESITHRARGIRSIATEMIRRAMRSIAEFAEQWTAASRDRILDGRDGWDPAPVFASLIKQDLLRAPAGCSDEDFVARLVTAYHKEPGPCRSHLINAITRAAHENPWGNPWDCQALEETAGHLLHATVWNVDA